MISLRTLACAGVAFGVGYVYGVAHGTHQEARASLSRSADRSDRDVNLPDEAADIDEVWVSDFGEVEHGD